MTLNSVIDAQAKQADGLAKHAEAILAVMEAAPPGSEVRPTVVTYTSVLDAHAKCPDGDGRAAVALLDRMEAAGIAPNNRTFGCCMNAQAKHGNARTADELLRRMDRAGL